MRPRQGLPSAGIAEAFQDGRAPSVVGPRVYFDDRIAPPGRALCQVSLEDLSPRVDPRIACAMILGIPAIAVIPLWRIIQAPRHPRALRTKRRTLPVYRRLGGLEPDAAPDGTQEPFGVRDETSYAIVLPYHAQVEAVRRYTLNDGDGKVYVEDRIYAVDRLYILGEFTSSEPGFDLEKAVPNKLLQWRADPRALLARFDANHDGHIDAQEDWKCACRR